MKFYKRDPNAAIAGMAALSLKQRGAYNSILDLLYAADGDLTDDDRLVARMMSCHWREWAAVKLELIALGKIWLEGGKIRAKRVQEVVKEASDFSQEQSRRASEGWQKRKTANNINDAVMPPGNASTATATATPTEEKKEIPSVSPKKGTRLPENFEPDASCHALAETLLFTAPASQEAFENFKDYWKAVPGQRGCKLDWQATFRNWLRNANKRGQNGQTAAHHPKPGSIADGFAKVRAVVAEAERREAEARGEGSNPNVFELPGLRKGPR